MSKENKTSDKPQKGNDFIADVSSSLLRQKAKEYAKFIYDEGYNDPIYHPDIMQTMKDFEAGFKAALSFCNDR